MTRTCRECGCSNFAACPGGCWWVDDDLCSSCAVAVDVADPHLLAASRSQLDDSVGPGGHGGDARAEPEAPGASPGRRPDSPHGMAAG